MEIEVHDKLLLDGNLCVPPLPALHLLRKSPQPRTAPQIQSLGCVPRAALRVMKQRPALEPSTPQQGPVFKEPESHTRVGTALMRDPPSTAEVFGLNDLEGFLQPQQFVILSDNDSDAHQAVEL